MPESKRWQDTEEKIPEQLVIQVILTQTAYRLVSLNSARHPASLICHILDSNQGEIIENE
ncbi:MAG: hypothetical protein ACI934_001056 [Pseudohongiellaceae bacterium]|jgi:hypothetical protein